MVLVRFNEEKFLNFSALDEDSILQVPWELGGEARKEEGNMVLEFNPDRPDLYSIQGITRAIRTFKGIEKFRGLNLIKGENIAEIDPPAERPYFMLGIIRKTKVGRLIEEIMDFQEKIHRTVGRNRKASAIGLHDLDKVRFPLTYKPIKRDFEFKPLGEENVVKLNAFMKRNEKALEYGNLVGEDIPGIVDAEGELISIPPILNSSITTVTEETENILVDVTGPDDRAVYKSLILILTSLSYPDGIIEDVIIKKKKHEESNARTPTLFLEKRIIPKTLLKKMLGYSLTDSEISSALSRIGYGLEDGKAIIPPYRFDVLDDIDLVEDILKGIGYNTIKRKKERFVSYGKENALRLVESRIRNLLIGYDLNEVINNILVNKKFNSVYGFRDRGIDIVNPISQEQDFVRTRISPSLMQTLLNNFRNPYPQRIYEIGTVYREGMEKDVLGIAVAHKDASFSEIKGIFIGIMEDLGIENYEIERDHLEMYVSGRLAGIKVDGKNLGFFGEVNPRILRGLGIKMPVAMGELEISEVKV